MSKNRLGEMVFQSHSGMTAEGDNRVLMQKVVKDIFAHAQKNRHDNPVFDKRRVLELSKTENVSMENMRDMILMKESFEIKRFSKILKEKIMEKGQPFYDVWMY